MHVKYFSYLCVDQNIKDWYNILLKQTAYAQLRWKVRENSWHMQEIRRKSCQWAWKYASKRRCTSFFGPWSYCFEHNSRVSEHRQRELSFDKEIELSFDKEIGYVEQLFKERSIITNNENIKKRLILFYCYTMDNCSDFFMLCDRDMVKLFQGKTLFILNLLIVLKLNFHFDRIFFPYFFWGSNWVWIGICCMYCFMNRIDLPMRYYRYWASL